MALTLDYTETLAVTHCWCGICVGIPENLYSFARRHKDREVYCPLGHMFVFGDTFEEKLERERRAHKATRELLEAEEKARRTEERSHAQTRGKLRRQEVRVHAGVCPCCNRTFQQLARHMKSKHPDWEPATA